MSAFGSKDCIQTHWLLLGVWIHQAEGFVSFVRVSDGFVEEDESALSAVDLVYHGGEMKISHTFELEEVTPAKAAVWLDNLYGEQRSIRSGRVSQLVKDMNNGNFRLSADCILFICDKLANGQHRLKAVVESGKTQKFLVLRTNDKDLFTVTDSGSPRRASDSLLGYSYASQIASISKWVIGYDNDVVFQTNTNVQIGKLMTRFDHVEFCRDHAELLSECAAVSMHLYATTKLLSSNIAGALRYVAITAGHPKEKVDDFLRQVYVDGGTTAANELRNRLIANQATRSKLPSAYLFGIALKALKAFLEGRRVGLLKWGDKEPLTRL